MDALSRALPSRRTIIAQLCSGVAALLSQPSRPATAQTSAPVRAQGYVRDVQTTGGIPGVMVSNGSDVVSTDANGYWRLPVEPGDSIFVIKPAHWRYLKTAGIPVFSYLYQPEGTPSYLGLRGPIVEPTGPLPQSIDFYLERHDEPGSFDVMMVADTQAANATELEFVRRDLQAHVRHSNARFAISHGDVMGDDLNLLSDYRRILDDTGMVWHHCPGNHDLNLDSGDPKYAFDAWKRYVGPTHYAFQHAGATFILLNNVDYCGRGAKLPNGRTYRGAIGEKQLAFVQNVLRSVPHDNLVVVSMHIPLVSFESPHDPSDTTEDRRALMEILAQRPNTLSFAGHSHTTEHHYLGRDNGFDRKEQHHHHVLTAFCGSWWSGPHDDRGIPIADSRDGSPRGFHVLSIDGNTYKTRFVPLNSSSEGDMRILTQVPMERLQLLVDVFDGGPRTRVICEFSGMPGAGFALSRSRMPDPYIVQTFANHKHSLKPWVEASVSSHIWTADFPLELPPGAHSCLIRVVTEYGQEHMRPYTLTIGT